MSRSKPKTTTTTTTVPTATNEPAMPGIFDDCDGFYKVSPGDQCDTIATEHGISKAQFMEWNTSVDDRKPTRSPGSHSFNLPFPCKDRPLLARHKSNQRSPVLQTTECSNLWLDY
ncbi:hypothetical protein PENANT_c008G11841 [Penicillium antarcticum]|uniref:LysM domain-containing protein n=1 Tax=Penicillium antarcticum TaxID=416450 RepID=A0A1V6QBX6_9EURO|nr:hypothetical protein PENANT_c008G11841 [Penicillium antarcticum]